MRCVRSREGRGSKIKVLGKHKASKTSIASAHLELCSPMFGETCMSKLMSEFEVRFSF